MKVLNNRSFSNFFKATEISGIKRSSYLTLLVGLLALAVWTTTAQLASAVIIPGSIKVFKNRTVLQHPDGGRVAEVLVQEGDIVADGQVILNLVNVQLESSVRSLQRQVFSEQVRLARLRAEMAYPEKTPQFPKPEDGEQALIVATEGNLFRSRQKNIATQLTLIQQQKGFAATEAMALERSVANEEVIVSKSKELVAKGFVSPMNSLNAEQNLIRRQAELAQARQRVAELEQRAPVLVEDFRNTSAAEFRAASERLLEIEERLRPARESLENLKVRSPIAGRVMNLTRLGPGSVLGAKETIAEIVPDNRGLIVEGSLSPDQVAFVAEGMPAVIRIGQLTRIGHEELRGKLTNISADSVTQGMLGTPSYLVQAVIEDVPAEVEQLLRPGMPVEIFAQTGTRTPLDYLTAPITEFLKRAARE